MRPTFISLVVAAGTMLAAGVLTVAVHAERDGNAVTTLSDPGSFTAPSTSTMSTGVTTSTSPGAPSVTATMASPQVTTTPTSAAPG